jgi:sugar phosphate isomerase/epimerase
MNTDGGPESEWTTRELDCQLMTQALKEASMVAERFGIKIGLEPHQQYSKSQEGLDSIYNLVKSPAIGITHDTRNRHLAGTTDTYEWLNHVKDRLVHLHAKDISFSQSTAEKGKTTGTPVGCACGDGDVDWKKVIETVKTCPVEIVFNVECGTVPGAIRSFEHLLG